MPTIQDNKCRAHSLVQSVSNLSHLHRGHLKLPQCPVLMFLIHAACISQKCCFVLVSTKADRAQQSHITKLHKLLKAFQT